MERPSHRIASLQFHTGSRRVTGLGLSFLLQGLVALALVSGFVVDQVAPTPVTKFTATEKPVEPQAPPPPIPNLERPALPTVALPQILVESAPSGPGISAVVPQTREPPVTPPPPPRVSTVPDRAPVSIAATHTSPPYPPVARRLGAEGKVTLRLTVLPDGKVGKAEVVTSSGRRDFDEAAQSWIVSRWTYQPAIRDGAPAAAQVMAAVNFTLTNP